MTALKPLENLRVTGVMSGRYPINLVCAHPSCKEKNPHPDGKHAHHIFPRSEIGNAYWFVQIEENGHHYTIPHVSWLCQTHHDDVEEHRAWIKLEEGVFVWYNRGELDWSEEEGNIVPWNLVGPLNPQPAGGPFKQAKGRAGRKNFTGEEKRKRRSVSMRVPDDAEEDGAGLYDDLLDQLRERYDVEEDYPAYHVTMRAFYEALTS